MDIQKQLNNEQQAYQYWDGFKDEIIYHNRFHPKHEVLGFLDDYLGAHKIRVEKGSLFYRARVIDYNSSDANTTGFVKQMRGEPFGNFEGFDEKNSFVPPADHVSPGRANPEKIVYLYIAKEVITAIAETRPRIFDHISVAKIELLQDICLADFTTEYGPLNSSLSVEIIRQLTAAFSSPCKNTIDYIPTQFIAEYVKFKGIDGIIFRSSFIPNGTNITIFRPEVAKPIASAPYRLDEIIYRARRMMPLQRIEDFDIIASNSI